MANALNPREYHDTLIFYSENYSSTVKLNYPSSQMAVPPVDRLRTH